MQLHLDDGEFIHRRRQSGEEADECHTTYGGRLAKEFTQPSRGGMR
ncbi:hypothetical protein GA0115259_107857 [Streptomyces sp. MnatMP-M17]|nr:hypothetical protein GA0115259_107857 [Streptomyces sp. MnatMP-M17]